MLGEVADQPDAFSYLSVYRKTKYTVLLTRSGYIPRKQSEVKQL